MGCGGASKQRITAPEIERPLVTDSEHATKGAEDRGSVVPLLSLDVIPRDMQPLPPQQLDLGKSSPSVSEECSAKPISPPKVFTTENGLSDSRKEEIPSQKVEDAIPVPRFEDTFPPPEPKPSTPPSKSDDRPSEAVPIDSSQPQPHASASVPTVPTGPDLLQEEVLRSFRAAQVSPPSTKPGKLELSPTNSAREQTEAEVVEKPLMKPIAVPPLPKEEILNEEVLGSFRGTPSSPPNVKPGKLELSSPKEPSFAFIPNENLQASDAPSGQAPASEEFVPQTLTRNLDLATTPPKQPLLNAVESSRKPENS